MKSRTIALITLLAFVASCSDDPNEPTGTEGTFSFTFGGEVVSGSYSASGSFPAGAGAETEWAVGFVDNAQGAVGAFAVIPKPNNRSDVAIIAIDRLTVGSESVSGECDPEAEECAGTGFAVMFNASDDGSDSDGTICGLISGTVALTGVSNSRITGTFSGTGTCVETGGAEGTFTVSNGTFNVPNLSLEGTALRVRGR